ncbi:helix-turn-helix domain-containing protein [Clostridium cadaveris]|uniref:helix-turn-helix domain-containing protein n=1 Tax=Clostridium cadaveris TaxID=1529 RepID=UPI003D2EEAEC
MTIKKNNDVEDCNIEWDNTSSLSNLVSDYEKKIITLVLNDSKNMADAAKKLKVSRQNLRYKIDKYNINYK